MLTNTNIVKQLELGIVKPHIIRMKKRTDNQSNNIQVRRDAIAIGTRHAASMISSSNYFVKYGDDNPAYIKADGYNLKQDFAPTWGRRQSHGEMYGQTYISNYKRDLTDMFQVGENNSSLKMNEGKMRDNLMLRYPNKFSIPGETDIKTFINGQFQKSKNKSSNKNSNPNERRGRKTNDSGAKPQWEVMIEMIANDNETMKPERIWQHVIEKVGVDATKWPTGLPLDTENKPNKIKIKDKINAFRTKMRKEKKYIVIT